MENSDINHKINIFLDNSDYSYFLEKSSKIRNENKPRLLVMENELKEECNGKEHKQDQLMVVI